MWLLFHRKAGTKVVPDGETLTERCPTCEKTTRFEEVEISEQLGVWFVDVVGDKQRAFRCRACGDTFELRDKPDERPAPRPPPPPAPAPKQIDRTRIEDELAALKKRLGK